MTNQESSEIDYYTILEVRADSSEREIVAAYKRMMLKWHPDRHRNNPPATRKYAAAMAALLNEARDVLTDRRRRAEYDAEFQRHSQQNGGSQRHGSQSQQSEPNGNHQGNHQAHSQSEWGQPRPEGSTVGTQPSGRRSNSEAAFRAGHSKICSSPFEHPCLF